MQMTGTCLRLLNPAVVSRSGEKHAFHHSPAAGFQNMTGIRKKTAPCSRSRPLSCLSVCPVCKVVHNLISLGAGSSPSFVSQILIGSLYPV